MSGECHTDGYGIYLLNEHGKELIGVRENDDLLSYEVEDGTWKICARAFEKMKHLEVLSFPASLQKVEEDAFSNGPRDFHIINHSDQIIYEEDFLIDPATKTLLFYTGHAMDIVIPSSIHIIGRQAFRSCNTETIELGDNIGEIHEDAFTTCRMERVSFRKGKAYVYFPQKDIRLRQHMLEGFGNNGIFDFARYDNDLLAGFMEDERMKMIAARLKWPLHLSQEVEEKYRSLVQKNIVSAVQCVGNAQDMFTMKLFLETQIIRPENVEECLEALHALDDLEAYAYVSDYQNKYFIKQDFDFDIG